ncbi:sensory box sensor histidine kinase/response regulator [Rhodobacterales bacterium Y4I]|nr:sensory box sensor histidine kinase/response regulator [Rhodobacterales bacterium Y4I]
MTDLGGPATGPLTRHSQRYSPEGLLLRYARGRVRVFPHRQAFAFAVSLLMGLILSPLAGAAGFGLHFLGDAIDTLYLRKVPGWLQRGASCRQIRRISTVTAGLHAAAVAAAASVPEWLGHVVPQPSLPDHGDPLLTLGLLTALALNAGLVLPFHRPSAFVRLAVYAVTPLAMLAFLHSQGWERASSPQLHLAGLAMLYAAVGWALYFASRNFDITRANLLAQAQQQEALEAANASLKVQRAEARRLALVAENANDITRLLDREGRTLWANDAFTRVTGYTLAEAKGKLLGDLIRDPDTSLEVLARISEARQAGRPLRVEILNRSKDGRTFWLETNQVPMLDACGRVDSYVAIERDITAAKLHEQELEKARIAAEEGARAKADFLATMSHEIRTPMNGVIGMAQLLRDSGLNEEQELYAGAILSSADTLLALINDVLDVSKMDAEGVSLSCTDFDPRACFEDTMRLLKAQAEAKGLDLLLDIKACVPARLHGDDRRIRQILLNLAGNAIKFTERGQVQVTLDAEPAGQGTGLVFSVADTGIGIPREMLSKVFERFSQADAAISRRFGGTGLGLAISRRLAEAMGGSISVASDLGIGSCFTVRLHLDPPRAKPAAAPDAAPQAGSIAALEGLRVLVAEDNAVNRVLLEKFLQPTPAEVVFAQNGREAVAQFEAFAPDIILMDMSMPEMDGLDATRAIRARAQTQPAIVALTANAFDSDREACLAAGMDEFMSKPVNRGKLLDLLVHLAPQAQSRRAG